MTYRLFLDDERFPSDSDEGEWEIARSSAEAIRIVQEMGFPEYISFDHDLGGDDTSIIFINWMITQCMDAVEFGELRPEFPKRYYVHSQNPIGVQNIKSLMASFIAHYYGDIE